MRRVISSTAVVLLALGAVGCQGEGPTAPPRFDSLEPLFHNAGPCTATAEPGHSEFAEHHIVFVAHQRGLGAGGHVPGSHRGFSACNPSGQP